MTTSNQIVHTAEAVPGERPLKLRWVMIGLALQPWGEPRETVDVDVTLLTGFGRAERAGC